MTEEFKKARENISRFIYEEIEKGLKARLISLGKDPDQLERYIKKQQAIIDRLKEALNKCHTRCTSQLSTEVSKALADVEKMET